MPSDKEDNSLLRGMTFLQKVALGCLVLAFVIVLVLLIYYWWQLRSINNINNLAVKIGTCNPPLIQKLIGMKFNIQNGSNFPSQANLKPYSAASCATPTVPPSNTSLLAATK